jgi:predicted dehydrogenase
VDKQLYYMSEKLLGSNNKEPLRDLAPGPRPPLHQFLDAVGGAKDQPLVAPREAAARVAVMEAMYRAARERTWVKVAG